MYVVYVHMREETKYKVFITPTCTFTLHKKKTQTVHAQV